MSGIRIFAVAGTPTFLVAISPPLSAAAFADGYGCSIYRDRLAENSASR